MKFKKEKKLENNDQEKALEKIKYSDKENIITKFIDIIKKRWLISGTNTLLLIAILVAIVILLNTFVQSLKLTPIDCTSNKEYTLTEESKRRISDIEDEIDLLFVGIKEDDNAISLARQYHKANKNINVEVVDINERTDLETKYNLTVNDQVVIVENGERSKTVNAMEFYTSDSNYNTIDITEEKITSAILNVTVGEIPKVYFLTGYSDYSLEYGGGMAYLASYLKDEVLEYESLNILTKGEIPEDCDTLVITTPVRDFDELTTTEIIKYINQGGNILWFNSSYSEKLELKNVNKILALYAIEPFDVGYIYESDQNKTALGYTSCIVEDVGNTEVSNKLSNVVLLNSTKINVNTEKLNELGIVGQDMIRTTDTTYFRKDVANTSAHADSDEKGAFTIAAIYTKTISKSENKNEDEAEKEEDKIKSRLIMFADNNFISDIQLSSQVSPMLFLINNKDVALNSLAFLTNQEADITIRKDYKKISSFTATEGQKSIIIKVIFVIPVGVMIFGIVVWQIRRRKK